MPIAYRDRVAELTLMDDLFMVKFFEGHPECAEVVLRAVLGRDDLHVLEVDTHHEEVSLTNRSASFDVLAQDKAGRRYDIEVQREASRAQPRRARFYASLMDAAALPAGADFDDLPESYIVFIVDGDALKFGLPVCRIDRTVHENGQPFGDGSHIIYVNAAYTYGDTELGDVMHDFKCADPAEMRCSVLAERACELKESEREVGTMGNSIADIFQEGREEGLREGHKEGRKEGLAEAVGRLADSGSLALDKIAALFDMTVDQVEECAARQGRTAQGA